MYAIYHCVIDEYVSTERLKTNDITFIVMLDFISFAWAEMISLKVSPTFN